MFRKLFIFLLMVSQITACSTLGINTPAPGAFTTPVSETLVSTATLTYTSTATPTPTFTPTITNLPTQTQSPRATLTPKPSPTLIPTEDVLLKLENELSTLGIIFTPETTSHLDADNYNFTVRFSEGILKRSGLTYVRLHPEVMRRLFLQSMGQLLYFQRDLFPERYRSFYQIELINSYTEDPNTLIDLAEEVLKTGSVPLKFRTKELSGSINSLSLIL